MLEHIDSKVDKEEYDFNITSKASTVGIYIF